MSEATEKLRAMLDERGVEWWPMRGDEAGYREDRDTEFLVYGCKHVAHEWGCRLQVDMLTPEQAIAATLGSGTCKMRLVYEDEDADGCIWPDHYECSACGAKVNGIMPYCDTEIPPRYCPNCRRKVVSE